MTKGFFLVLEGIDGSGTTTQAGLVAARVEQRGQKAVVTHEPSTGPIGRYLRRALSGELEVEGTKVELAWDSMALLFAADRMDHLGREVLPALEQGALVISDRYDLSSLIYQSATCPDGEAALPWLVGLNARAKRPDLTIVLDVPVEASEARRHARGGKEEIYERRDLQMRLRTLYADARRLIPADRIEVISGEGAISEVTERIWALLAEHPEFGRIHPTGG